MTLRETVARAMWKDASERGADGFDSALDYEWHETDEDTREPFLSDAAAALRAVADAGPDDAMVEAAARVIEQDVKDYSGGFVTAEEAKKIARAALAAAFKTMGR